MQSVPVRPKPSPSLPSRVSSSPPPHSCVHLRLAPTPTLNQTSVVPLHQHTLPIPRPTRTRTIVNDRTPISKRPTLRPRSLLVPAVTGTPVSATVGAVVGIGKDPEAVPAGRGSVTIVGDLKIVGWDRGRCMLRALGFMNSESLRHKWYLWINKCFTLV